MTTNIRVIENNVIADDGQIIVLGGLIKDDTSDSEEKVRGLGDIPVLGNLFKYRRRASARKTNLMVFLRPVIVRSKEDSNSIATDRYDYMRSAGERAQPDAGLGRAAATTARRCCRRWSTASRRRAARWRRCRCARPRRWCRSQPRQHAGAGRRRQVPPGDRRARNREQR